MKWAKRTNGRIEVDDRLQLVDPKGKGRIFALGDCAHVSGSIYPAIAQVRGYLGTSHLSLLHKGSRRHLVVSWSETLSCSQFVRCLVVVAQVAEQQGTYLAKALNTKGIPDKDIINSQESFHFASKGSKPKNSIGGPAKLLHAQPDQSFIPYRQVCSLTLATTPA